MFEEWRDVVGFESKFEVSCLGKIRNKKTGRILKQTTNKKGYQILSTRPDGKYGKYKVFRVHRVVAEAFLEQPSRELIEKCEKEHWGKVIVRHKDHDKQNNVVSNLEWGSNQDNIDDTIRDGLFVYPKSGVESPSSKFSADEIEYIRNVYVPYHKEFGCRALAKKFKVSHPIVSDIVNNKSYKI